MGKPGENNKRRNPGGNESEGIEVKEETTRKRKSEKKPFP